MSVDGTKILYEGFLQKRKDTMKILWATYWFRLQNTTLFFYTKKNGSAPHLRGNYYIYSVQTVREIQRSDSKRFMFEIIMTSGKRKLLAAESEALRQEWVRHLWRAMQLAASGVSHPRSTHPEVCEQRDRIKSSTLVHSHSNSVKESLAARPLSVPAVHLHHEVRSTTPPACQLEEAQTEEEPVYQNTEPACSYQHHNDDSSPRWSSGPSDAEAGADGDYDVLPCRKNTCEVDDPSAETEEDGVYDVPLSCRRAAEHPDPTESIYDVPSALLRKISDDTSEDGPCLRI